MNFWFDVLTLLNRILSPHSRESRSSQNCVMVLDMLTKGVKGKVLTLSTVTVKSSTREVRLTLTFGKSFVREILPRLRWRGDSSWASLHIETSSSLVCFGLRVFEPGLVSPSGRPV